MAEATKIEWCTHTWSPWIGCTKLTAACDHCYAADMANRRGWAKFEAGAPRHRTSSAYWRKPLQWNARAAASGEKETVFPSLCDPYDVEVTPEWRDDFMALIEATPDLEWLVLTKRPKVARQYHELRPVPDNLRLGTTAENQKMLNLRGPDIIAIKAKLRPFLSLEPLLGGIDAYNGDPDPRLEGVRAERSMLGHWWEAGEPRKHPGHFGFGWVIAGGESGPKARPSHPDWFRSLRDQCAAADVPFFFKQWGEWTPGENVERKTGTVRTATWFGGEWSFDREDLANEEGHVDDQPDLYRVGKKEAGAKLDGVEHSELPGEA